MIIEKTFLADSSDRAKIAKYNPLCGEPFLWFDTEFFRNEDMLVTTFDFFINWFNNTLQPIIWEKRSVYNFDNLDPDIIYKSILRCDGTSFFNKIKLYAKNNGFELYYILIPDIPEDAWNDFSNKVVMFNIDQYFKNNKANCVEQHSIGELIEIIHNYRVKYTQARMDFEGLKFSSTNLELFLSRRQPQIGYLGDAIYPGDVDVLLYNENYKTQAIIEVKKHSIGSRKRYASTIGKESIELYIKHDYLKYKSLDILQKHMKCEFIMLFYPTTSENTIKLQKINELKPVESIEIALPIVHSNP